jgi:hypothetical protein
LLDFAADGTGASQSSVHSKKWPELVGAAHRANLMRRGPGEADAGATPSTMVECNV